MAFVRAVLYLGVTFGLALSDAQMAALILVVELGLGLLAPRSAVVSTGKVKERLAASRAATAPEPSGRGLTIAIPKQPVAADDKFDAFLESLLDS